MRRQTRAGRLIERWFRGARINTCFNAFDRHVDGGRAQQTALIYDGPVTGIVRKFSYRERRVRCRT